MKLKQRDVVLDVHTVYPPMDGLSTREVAAGNHWHSLAACSSSTMHIMISAMARQDAPALSHHHQSPPESTRCMRGAV